MARGNKIYEKALELFNKNYIDTECIKTKTIKPPLGIEPRFILRDKRIREIRWAITRYMESKQSIPTEWIEEYNQLVKEL